MVFKWLSHSVHRIKWPYHQRFLWTRCFTCSPQRKHQWVSRWSFSSPPLCALVVAVKNEKVSERREACGRKKGNDSCGWETWLQVECNWGSQGINLHWACWDKGEMKKCIWLWCNRSSQEKEQSERWALFYSSALEYAWIFVLVICSCILVVAFVCVRYSIVRWKAAYEWKEEEEEEKSFHRLFIETVEMVFTFGRSCNWWRRSVQVTGVRSSWERERACKFELKLRFSCSTGIKLRIQLNSSWRESRGRNISSDKCTVCNK